MQNIIEDQTIQKEDWSGEKRESFEISNCVFNGCNFTETDFTGTKFIECVFDGCNFSNSKIVNCSFCDVVFTECKISGVVFGEINKFLLSWKFHDCAVKLCSFSMLDIKNSAFVGCEIHETDFVDSDLTGSDFANSDLKGSKFHNANLSKANFVGAVNYYIDPTANKIAKAKFSSPEVMSLLAGFDIIIS
ncbi:MAG: pentapeptide repeat-containing protein [Parcubacteria group bacterium]|jgi:uncharacterized protein YjbI with pentapeptide repeats